MLSSVHVNDNRTDPYVLMTFPLFSLSAHLKIITWMFVEAQKVKSIPFYRTNSARLVSRQLNQCIQQRFEIALPPIVDKLISFRNKPLPGASFADKGCLNQHQEQAPVLSNPISLIHGSRIKWKSLSCQQFRPYSYQILCHVGGTSPPTWHKIW